MSSAILYLAIVAIWACVLVPRWLHRSHDATSEPEVPVDQELPAEGPEDYEHAEFSTPAEPDADAAGRADPIADGSATYGDMELADSAAYADGEAAGSTGRPPAPAASRAHVLQARRRMLTMLVALAVAVMSCVLLGLTGWWTAVPPIGMLGVYLLLLREAARADAEALGRAEAHARAQAAREARERARLAHERAREAYLASQPQPTAEVIDISGRTVQDADEPYDQYADAAVRAVGD